MPKNLTLSAIVASPEMHQQTDARPNKPLQRTRPRLRFLLNLNSHGWGHAAEGAALHTEVFRGSSLEEVAARGDQFFKVMPGGRIVSESNDELLATEQEAC